MRYLVFLVCSVLMFQSMAQLEPCRDDSGLYGFCDQQGNTVIEHKYYDALDFIDGHAAVLIDHKWGIINESGHVLVPATYDKVINCVNVPDQILVQTEGKWHFINTYGIQLTTEYEVQTPWYEFELNGPDANFQEDTWFAVIKKGKWGVVDLYDNVKMPFSFDWTRVIRREVAGKRGVVSIVLKDKGKYAWQRVDAKAATGFEFDEYLGEYENKLFFSIGSRAVAIDAISGERIQSLNRDYYNLLDAEDSVGLVSAAGKIIIPFKYELVDIGRVENHVVFGNFQQFGISDLNGNVLLKPVYKEIKSLGSNPPVVAVKNQQDQVAVISLVGESPHNITDFKYKYAVKDGDQIRISLGSKVGFLSADGVESWNN